MEVIRTKLLVEIMGLDEITQQECLKCNSEPRSKPWETDPFKICLNLAPGFFLIVNTLSFSISIPTVQFHLKYNAIKE